MKKIDKFAPKTLRKLADPGLLLVSAKKNGEVNVMTIGWGLVGRIWGKPVFVVAVRPSRFTHEFIENSGEFTVNVPGEGLEEAVAYCGKVSGRKCDKLKECELAVSKGRKVGVPVIKKCGIHYECRVVHKLKIKPSLVPGRVKRVFYSKGDYHTVYFGEILAVY